MGTVFCKRAAGGSNPFAVVKPEIKKTEIEVVKALLLTKISTAGKVLSGLLASKHSEIK
ncbi:MAG: hypothetical protein UDQ50_09375 [Streptococcus lutetiensis]|nr:hypothetical protein [Streptococcus lutetiensis]MEE0355907.1 hypothetical protein [Streptococcus lutetiensis]